MDKVLKSRKSKRLYLVNREFQLRYTFAAVAVGILSTLLTSLIILYPLYVFEILRIPAFLPPPILLVMVFAAFVNIGLIGFLGIFITHKIAGPMYSLVRQFRRIEEGVWSGHMGLRDGDDFRYIVRNFNAMVDSIVTALRADHELIGRIKQRLEDEEVSDVDKIAGANKLISELESNYQERLTSQTSSEVKQQAG